MICRLSSVIRSAKTVDTNETVQLERHHEILFIHLLARSVRGHSMQCQQAVQVQRRRSGQIWFRYCQVDEPRPIRTTIPREHDPSGRLLYVSILTVETLKWKKELSSSFACWWSSSLTGCLTTCNRVSLINWNVYVSHDSQRVTTN